MSFDPPAPPRLPALDALRAVGAAAVVGTHVGIATGWGNSQWGGLIARLDVGVAIFFVLSGFVLFRPFAWAHAHRDRRPHPGRYLWRRALRILPAYWLTVAVCLLVVPSNAGASWGEWVRYATLTQFYERGHYHDALGQTWSLTVEVVFYLLLPVLAVLTLGRSWRPRRTVTILCAGGILISGGWLGALSTGRLDMGLHPMWLPGLAVWFAAGMALATLEVSVATGGHTILTEAARAPLTWWALAAGTFLVAGTPLTGPRDLSDPTAAQFGAKLALFLVVAVAVVLPVAFAGPGPIRAALSAPVASWLGTVSYGLFLWHPLVLTVLHPDLAHETVGSTLRVYALTVGGALILASLSWYGLEQPLQRLGRRRAIPTRPAPTDEKLEPARPTSVSVS